MQGLWWCSFLDSKFFFRCLITCTSFIDLCFRFYQSWRRYRGFRCISYDGRNLQHKMQPVVFCVWAKQPVESRLAPPWLAGQDLYLYYVCRLPRIKNYILKKYTSTFQDARLAWYINNVEMCNQSKTNCETFFTVFYKSLYKPCFRSFVLSSKTLASGRISVKNIWLHLRIPFNVNKPN